jgi:hypothetical protein
MRLVLPFICIIQLAACSAFDADVPFSSQDAAFIRQSGTTTVQGHVFIQHYPKPILAAGEIVRLIPITPYSKAKIKEIFGEDKNVLAILAPKIEWDPEYQNYTRTTKTETDGRFSLSNVAAGHYYIQSKVTWRKDTSIITEGRLVYDEITVTGHETEPVKVILSGN